MDRFEPAVRALRERLVTHLNAPGIEVEDKRYSLAIHYPRGVPERAAHDAILDALGDLPPGLRLTHGKSLINVIPARAPNKGDALLNHWDRVGTKRAIFIGDDRTDEDVFELLLPDRLLAIRVGRSVSSAAP